MVWFCLFLSTSVWILFSSLWNIHKSSSYNNTHCLIPEFSAVINGCHFHLICMRFGLVQGGRSCRLCFTATAWENSLNQSIFILSHVFKVFSGVEINQLHNGNNCLSPPLPVQLWRTFLPNWRQNKFSKRDEIYKNTSLVDNLAS